MSTQWHPILFTVKVKIANDELLFETKTLNEWCLNKLILSVVAMLLQAAIWLLIH